MSKKLVQTQPAFDGLKSSSTIPKQFFPTASNSLGGALWRYWEGRGHSKLSRPRKEHNSDVLVGTLASAMACCLVA